MAGKDRSWPFQPPGAAQGADTEPPGYWAVLNEAVIRRIAGGPDAMSGQLRHIADLAELPHVSSQVLPFGAGW